MKKIVKNIAILSAMILSLTACGNSTTGKSAKDDYSSCTEDININNQNETSEIHNSDIEEETTEKVETVETVKNKYGEFIEFSEDKSVYTGTIGYNTMDEAINASCEAFGNYDSEVMMSLIPEKMRKEFIEDECGVSTEEIKEYLYKEFSEEKPREWYTYLGFVINSAEQVDVTEEGMIEEFKSECEYAYKEETSKTFQDVGIYVFKFEDEKWYSVEALRATRDAVKSGLGYYDNYDDE